MKKYLFFFSLFFLMSFILEPLTVRAKYDDVNSGEFQTFIKDFLDRRTSSLTETTKPHSLLKSSDDMIRESEIIYKNEMTAIAELERRKDVLKDWGESYTHHYTKVNMKNVETKGDTLVVDIEEYTELFYEKINGNEPEYTAFVSERQFFFEKTPSGEWKLIAEQLVNPYGPVPINEPAGVTKEEMKSALEFINTLNTKDDEQIRIKDSLKASSTSVIHGSYDRTKAKDYAIKYWKNYNNKYRKFDNDCTNFISQAMYAGGWTHVSGYYRNAKYWWYNFLNQTWSWTSVSYWHDFANKHSKRTIILKSPRSLTEGDVLQIDFTNNGSKDHTMIVTKKTYSEIYLTYHTNDTLNRSFASISVAHPKAKWIPHLVKSSF